MIKLHEVCYQLGLEIVSDAKFPASFGVCSLLCDGVLLTLLHSNRARKILLKQTYGTASSGCKMERSKPDNRVECQAECGHKYKPRRCWVMNSTVHNCEQNIDGLRWANILAVLASVPKFYNQRVIANPWDLRFDTAYLPRQSISKRQFFFG